MNCKAVALLVVFCAVMLAETDAWRVRIRLRRIWERVRKPLCGPLCSYACTVVTGAVPICGLGCKTVCGRRKRAAGDLFEGDDGKIEIPLPRDFNDYDSNEDGYIDLEELADFLELKPEGVKKAFDCADSDGDSKISESEFDEAPWVFE